MSVIIEGGIELGGMAHPELGESVHAPQIEMSM